jgi:pilus assembly protein CpaE
MFQYFKKSQAKRKHDLRIGLVTLDGGKPRRNLNDLGAGEDGVIPTYIASSTVTTGGQARDINVYVYDLSVGNEQAMSEFDRFMRERPAAIPVIVVSETINEELVRWFLRLRVADWVKVPYQSGELIAACGRVLSQSTSPKSDATCLAFIGAKGGVGTTTIALHAALASAAKSKTASTCLVDLDFGNSSCTDYLDLTPGWAIDDLIGDPSRLDAHMFGSLLAQHRSGLSILAAQRKLGDTEEFSEEVITRPLDLAMQRFGTLVIDVPRSAQRWMENVVQGATGVFIVTEFTVPGLKAARRMVGQFADQFGSDLKPRIIVNRYERSYFGSNLAATEAKELLGSYLAGFVGEDRKLVHEAINRGVPTTDIKNRNSIAKDVAKIVGLVA